MNTFQTMLRIYFIVTVSVVFFTILYVVGEYAQ